MSKNSKRPAPTRRRDADTTALTTFLSGLNIGVKPTFHVNGSQFLTAVVTVDLGEPLKSVKLTADQDQTLTGLLRHLATDITGRTEGRITIHRDHHRGIYWANANG